MNDVNPVSGDEARLDSIRRFAVLRPDYYVREFDRLQRTSGRVWSFNVAAAALGPLWAGARGIWGFFTVATFAEVCALVQIGRGWFGSAGAAAYERAQQLQDVASARSVEAQAAAAHGKTQAAETLALISRNLQTAADQALAQADQAAAGAHTLLVGGLAMFACIRLLEGLAANIIYERQYCAWRSNNTVPSGVGVARLAMALALLLVIYPLTVYRFAAAHVPAALLHIPVDKLRFAAMAGSLDGLFDRLYRLGSGSFDSVRDGIRVLVGAFETLLVGTPWPVVMTALVVLAWRLAGARLAVFTTATIAYLALLGLWEPAMQTVALLGTAALICIVVGIPLGIWFSRSTRAYAVARPVLDLMQTMPSMVYLIPAIALFGTGTPPGVIATVIFGLPPVVRLTALGLQQVPAEIKECARAYGASNWQLLTGVELPLAMPSIMTGVNQTILMCLSMVVVAALIGAQGLGSVVLEALQFAATGQGILAGLAILLCAIVIDRLVQGAFTRRRGRRGAI
jgi:glycine betaine/proline transport system permease protein